MSVNVMPIGGKFDNDGDPVVKGIAVDEDGGIISRRSWKNEVIKILDSTDPIPSENGTITLDATQIDLSNAGAVSLRVRNGLNVAAQIVVCLDYMSSDVWMCDADGSTIVKTVQANKNAIITPDDMPTLQWLAKLRIRVKITGETITGNLKVWAVVKG